MEEEKEKKMKGKRKIDKVSIGRVSEARRRKRKNLSARHEE